MNYALNEVEAMAKRASRGAGYPWGLAEEAAKATRWLCAQHVDGCAELAGLLEADLAATLRDHRPTTLDKDWQGQGALCPLSTGATLSDFAARAAQEPVIMRAVMRPALLLPFTAYVARKTGGCFTITCEGSVAITDGQSLELARPFPSNAETLTIRAGGHLIDQPAWASRATPAAGVWNTLSQLAHRTYAPATEESRLLGAGSGLSDND